MTAEMEQSPKQSPAEARTETHLEISVWNNFEGDVVKKLWDASWDDYDDLIEQYEDEPGYDVVIDREWEEGVDDE